MISASLATDKLHSAKITWLPPSPLSVQAGKKKCMIDPVANDQPLPNFQYSSSDAQVFQWRDFNSIIRMTLPQSNTLANITTSPNPPAVTATLPHNAAYVATAPQVTIAQGSPSIAVPELSEKTTETLVSNVLAKLLNHPDFKQLIGNKPSNCLVIQTIRFQPQTKIKSATSMVRT